MSHYLSSGKIHGGHFVCGYLLLAGLIPNARCSSSELVVSWKPSAFLLQVSHPGTGATLLLIPMLSRKKLLSRSQMQIKPTVERLSSTWCRIDGIWGLHLITQLSQVISHRGRFFVWPPALDFRFALLTISVCYISLISFRLILILKTLECEQGLFKKAFLQEEYKTLHPQEFIH